MRSVFLPLLMIALLAPTERPEGPDAAVTVIRAGTLLDGRSDQPRRNQLIVVRGRRIAAVGDAASRGHVAVSIDSAPLIVGAVERGVRAADERFGIQQVAYRSRNHHNEGYGEMHD